MRKSTKQQSKNMETKLNIAEILKDKPIGTKLYTDAFGELSIRDIDVKYEPSITLSNEGGYILYFYSDGRYSSCGEPILFPSKDMRDWSKLTWKKGDVLVGVKDSKSHIIFDKFNDDTYTTFTGKRYFKATRLGHNYIPICSSVPTEDFYIKKDDTDKTYTNIIGEKLGGKQNLTTLKIEKAHPEFKDWDFITIKLSKGSSLIGVFKAEDDKKYYLHANLDSRGIITISEDSYCKKSTCIARLSTEEEKQQFFDALAKKGKTWDAVKKQIVDLKLNDKLKPFDKVLVKDCLDEMWRPSFFACYLPFGREPYQVIGGEWVKLCIPYEGNESLLGTRTEI